MPDDFDRASALEQQQRQYALDRCRGNIDFTMPSRATCVVCAEAIPPKRQALGGVSRCVVCQKNVEQFGQFGQWKK